SVVLRADIELGGSDQRFNLLVGRQLQQESGQPPQVVITMPLLEGLDGGNKMSKSLGNCIGITDPPDDMFGKLMSISDEMMWRYFELLSFRPLEDISALRRATAEGRNPRDVKFELALELVGRFHGHRAAELAHREFVARFQQKRQPQELDWFEVPVPSEGCGIAQVLRAAKLVASSSEGNRKIREGAVR